MKREYKDYIVDILDAIEKIARFTKDMDLQYFKSDDKTVFAVVKALEIIGEAVRKVPKQAKLEYPEIPWSEMAGIGWI